MANTIKAFNLQLLVGRENIMGNKHKVSIESIDAKDKNLYIGASDGTIYHFLLLEDALQGSGTTEPKVSSFLQAQTRISSKKAIVQIKACAALKCILVNADGLIQGYSMLDLSPSFAMLSRLKNVNRFYVNEHPVDSDPFSVEMYVTFVKKKNIQLYQVQEDNVIPLRDLSFNETPISLAVDGNFLCIGGSSNYFLYDLNSNKRQDLVPVENGKAFVHRVGTGEFLLAAPNSLGFFVTSAGISQRAPIPWADDVLKASFVHPYVIALDSQRVTVHSVLDQEVKQSWPFQGGVYLVKDEIGVLLCTSKDVFILSLIPFSHQISKLIRQGCVDEALELAKECAKIMRREPLRELLTMTYRKAGFQYMRQFEFTKSQEMFTKGDIDVREIISVFPNILPANTAFVPHSPSYHEMKLISDFCANSSENIRRCYAFLSEYLLTNILPAMVQPNSSQQLEANKDHERNRDVLLSSAAVFANLHETSNLLYIFCGKVTGGVIKQGVAAPLFNVFVNNSENISNLLQINQCYHVSAIFNILISNIDEAMFEWKDLVMGAKADCDFPGLQFVADMLGVHYQKIDILWKHTEWILRHDESVGITIFTNHAYNEHESTSDDSVFPKEDEIIDFLHPFKDSVLLYLEHLVFVRRVQKEKYHTHLAVLYLENVLEIKSAGGDQKKYAALRVKLQKLLKESSLYRISLIQGKVQDSDLFQEHVILCGKQGEHQKALEILVNRVKDQAAAESYCMDQSDDFSARKELFKSLLKIYLNKITATTAASSKYVVAVADLLNRRSEFYNPLDVMHLLSNEWSMQLLHQFLTGTMQANIHAKWTSRIEKTLASGRLRTASKDLVSAVGKSVVLTEDSICRACNATMQDPDCVIYPNLVAVHPRCGRDRHVCPVTGQLFKVEKKLIVAVLPNNHSNS